MDINEAGELAVSVASAGKKESTTRRLLRWLVVLLIVLGSSVWTWVKDRANDQRTLELDRRELQLDAREASIVATMQHDGELRSRLDAHVSQYLDQAAQFGSTFDDCTQERAYAASRRTLDLIDTLAGDLSDGGGSYRAFVAQQRQRPIIRTIRACDLDSESTAVSAGNVTQ